MKLENLPPVYEDDSRSMIEHRNAKKVKYAIQTDGSNITYIAGLYRYEEHCDMQVPVFSVLTRESAGSVRDIHVRMPLILNKEDIKDWIRPNGDPSTIVEKALSNMVFERAFEYPRFPPEIITA